MALVSLEEEKRSSSLVASNTAVPRGLDGGVPHGCPAWTGTHPGMEMLRGAQPSPTSKS